jgi:peptide/nickel transport system permease protein
LTATARTAQGAQGYFASMVRRDPWLFVGLLAFFGLVFLALFGERIAPHEAIYFVPEHGSDPRPYDPGLVFPFGSDVLGRDLFSVVLAGARATLTIVVLSGAARVVAGALVAAVSGWWRPTRIATESLAELASAVPATLVALVLVKVFLRPDPSILLVTGALLVTGWAGPYRVIRAEVDRLRVMSFTQGAIAIGVGRWRLFWRHHLPHLAPVLAVNLSQQIVASLVLVAELGVLSVFVGATRFINLEESLTRAAIREVPFAQIADPPEWGGLLANARTIESLWTTRWLFLVPGVAFAVTAVAVAMIGFALARRYAKWDITQDVHGRGAAVLVASLLAIFLASTLVPERYAAAREWAAAARAEIRPATAIESTFAEAGLKPIGASYAVQRDAGTVVQAGPAALKVGVATAAQIWPRRAPERGGPIHVQSFVTANTGGGTVEAPLVFVGRGISPSEHPAPPKGPAYGQQLPELNALIANYADDYEAVDVHGKVVLQTNQSSGIGTAGANPYLRFQAQLPPATTSGVPVVVVDPGVASALVASTGLDLSPYSQYDSARRIWVFDDYMGVQYKQSPARDLGVSARVEVPLARAQAIVTSYVGEVGGVSSESGRVLVWSERKADQPSLPTRDVLAALARALGDRRVPIVFVDFDPAGDPRANAKAIAAALQGRRISLVVVLDRLDGSALRFTTANGELVPALDMYADKAAARHELTRTTATATAVSDVAPLLDYKTVVVSGNGGAGDLRPDAAAFVGYLAGRLALGAEELPR